MGRAEFEAVRSAGGAAVEWSSAAPLEISRARIAGGTERGGRSVGHLEIAPVGSVRGTMTPMIVVIGEALVDVVSGADGTVAEALGGAPYNTSRAIARLGGDVEFVGCLSTDDVGNRLAAGLAGDGVGLGHVRRTDLPSTVARATIGDGGGATYVFELQGTASPSLDRDDLSRLPAAPDIVFTGGLALVAEPSASAIADYVDAVPPSTIVVIDVNSRPDAITDEAAYRDLVTRVLARADVVKVSDEDIEVLHPGDRLEAVADRLAGHGAAVVVTAGAQGCILVRAGDVVHVPAAPLPGPLVDTIGAGDTFDGALLYWLAAQGVDRAGLTELDLRPGLEAASRAAAYVVTRRGADPPTST